MTDTERTAADHLATITGALGQLARTYPAAYARCADLARGAYLASPALEGQRASGVSDPTSRRALRPDPIVNHRREADRRIRAILADAAWLLRFADAYPAPHLGDTPDEPRCVSCARLGHDAPAHTLSGRTEARSRPLCRTCWRYAGDHGELPDLRTLADFHRTGRMRFHTHKDNLA